MRESAVQSLWTARFPASAGCGCDGMHRIGDGGAPIMFGLVKNLVGVKSCPIGVDFGTDSLRLAQVAPAGQEWKLVAAASADVPSHVRHDTNARMQFFVQTTKDLMSQGGFTGRGVALALPAASMFIQHLRLPKMDD